MHPIWTIHLLEIRFADPPSGGSANLQGGGGLTPPPTGRGPDPPPFRLRGFGNPPGTRKIRALRARGDETVWSCFSRFFKKYTKTRFLGPFQGTQNLLRRFVPEIFFAQGGSSLPPPQSFNILGTPPSPGWEGCLSRGFFLLATRKLSAVPPPVSLGKSLFGNLCWQRIFSPISHKYDKHKYNTSFHAVVAGFFFRHRSYIYSSSLQFSPIIFTVFFCHIYCQHFKQIPCITPILYNFCIFWGAFFAHVWKCFF